MPTPDGVKTMLDDLAPRNPKAAAADPKSFVDMSLVQEVEASGFLKQLYKRSGKENDYEGKNVPGRSARSGDSK
jgi:hypothetical protein